MQENRRKLGGRPQWCKCPWPAAQWAPTGKLARRGEADKPTTHSHCTHLLPWPPRDTDPRRARWPRKLVAGAAHIRLVVAVHKVDDHLCSRHAGQSPPPCHRHKPPGGAALAGRLGWPADHTAGMWLGRRCRDLESAVSVAAAAAGFNNSELSAAEARQSPLLRNGPGRSWRKAGGLLSL